MTTPLQEPAAYNAGVGYPVDQVIDGNLTLVDVYSNGKYGNLTARQVSAPITGLAPSGDTTAVTDPANINNLLGTFGVTDLQLAPGQWYGKTQVTIPVSSKLRGSGPGTFYNYSGNGPAFYQHDITGTGGGGFGTYHTAAGGIRDLTIDGTSAGASAIGASVGDGWGFRVENIRIQNFTGANAIGLYLNNQFGWTEKGRFQATLWGNTTQCVLDGNNGGQQSFEFNNFDFDVFVFAGQNGVSARNGAFLNKCTLRIVGNFLAGSSSLATNFVLQFTGSATGSNSRMQRGIIDIDVELNTTNTNGPQTINFGAAANKITDCTGSLVFDPTPTATNFLASNATAGQFTFGGVIVGDASLLAVNTQPQGWLSSLILSGAYSTQGSAISVTNTVTPAAAPFQWTAFAAADQVFGVQVTGDTFERFRFDSNAKLQWGSGAAAADTQLFRGGANLLQVGLADLDIAATGRGLRVGEGANAKQGTAVLSAGSVVVANTSVTASSRIFLTSQADGGTPGFLRVSARTAGTSFTITSGSSTDTSTVAYEIFEPG